MQSQPDYHNMQTHRMTMRDLTPNLRRPLALREGHRGGVTQMARNVRNKDRGNTTSVPSHMAEIGTGNLEQDRTLRRTAKIRASWTEQEKQNRLAYRTMLVELQFRRFLQLIGQGRFENAVDLGDPVHCH